MIKYNIEVKYISNNLVETRNMYYKSISHLNDEQQDEVIKDFIDTLKRFYGIDEILETYIWEDGKDREKINLNKLKNYTMLSYANPVCQLNKVKEEYQELLNEVEIKNGEFISIKDRDNFIAEALDLITATTNLILLAKATEQDFNRHIEKLNIYKNGKYKKDI